MKAPQITANISFLSVQTRSPIRVMWETETMVKVFQFRAKALVRPKTVRDEGSMPEEPTPRMRNSWEFMGRSRATRPVSATIRATPM